MLRTLRKDYNRNNIVSDDKSWVNIQPEHELITKAAEKRDEQERANRRRIAIKSESCVIPSGRSAEEIDLEIRELRSERF